MAKIIWVVEHDGKALKIIPITGREFRSDINPRTHSIVPFVSVSEVKRFITGLKQAHPKDVTDPETGATINGDIWAVLEFIERSLDDWKTEAEISELADEQVRQAFSVLENFIATLGTLKQGEVPQESKSLVDGAVASARKGIADIEAWAKRLGADICKEAAQTHVVPEPSGPPDWELTAAALRRQVEVLNVRNVNLMSQIGSLGAERNRLSRALDEACAGVDSWESIDIRKGNETWRGHFLDKAAQLEKETPK